MQTEYLREFVILAKYMNFNTTASILNMTQPTLSRHIMQLEQELGVTLFKRDTQSVSLTDEGNVCLEEFKRILEHIDRSIERIHSYKEGVTGNLTIAYKDIYGS